MFLKVQEKPSKTFKGFRQRVARQMREHPKEKEQEKNHLKYFANKFKSQTGKQRRRGRRGGEEMGRVAKTMKQRKPFRAG